jgi:Fic family protein
MNYSPRYTITNKTLNTIAKIAAVREIIEHSRIIPAWEIKLVKEARIHSAHSSTSIEGNRLTLQEVRDLAQQHEVIAVQKDKQEVLNYLKALDAIPKYASEIEVDIRLFLRMHQALTRKVLHDDSDSGAFRTRQVFVGRRIFNGTVLKDIVEYMPPATKDVPALTEAFLKWLNHQKPQDVHPVILAGIAHYEVARIHPFIDGNGRAARLLASLVLYKHGFDHRRFFALDDYYDENRPAYYAALKKVQQQENDLTEWLEYFSEGVLFSVSKVKDAVSKLGVISTVENTRQIELSPRQIEIVEQIGLRGKITNKEIKTMYNISRQAILKEIAKLIKENIIVLKGEGRGAHYQLKFKKAIG